MDRASGARIGAPEVEAPRDFVRTLPGAGVEGPGRALSEREAGRISQCKLGENPKYLLFWRSPLFYKAAPQRQFRPPKCKLMPPKM